MMTPLLLLVLLTFTATVVVILCLPSSHAFVAISHSSNVLPRKRTAPSGILLLKLNLKSTNKQQQVGSNSRTSTTSSSTTTNNNDDRNTVLSSASASPYKQLEYDWKEQWYALTYASYVPNPSESAEVVPASVFGHPLALWRSQDNGPIYCADDVCPHRAAALTEGRLRDGNLECYYHGWQFSGTDNGQCTFVPQLEPNATIPRRACLRMRTCRVFEGIVWVWMGGADDAEDVPPSKDIPTQADGLDPITGEKDGFILNDFQIDLPYDHSYLVENLIDPAHIPISHDRTPGGGRRENAQAYEMIVDSDSISPQGFTGRFRTFQQQQNKDPFIEVRYEAPGIIRQIGFPRGKNSTVQFGAALHCMPLTLGRSRLLFRAYFGGLPPFLTFLFGSKPKFLRDLNSCKILEQDVGLITTQEDHFKRNTDRKIKDDFLMLKSSDVFVRSYRQWLDQVGHGMPWFQGLATRSNNVDDHLTSFVIPPALDPIHHRASNVVETRYHRHVMHCPNTRKALRRIKMMKKIMSSIAIAAITLLFGLSGSSSIVHTNGGKVSALTKASFRLLVPLIPLASLTAAGLHRLEQSFFVSFKRKDQLREEKGI